MLRSNKLFSLRAVHRKFSTIQNTNIKNQQKDTLLDKFGRNHNYLRISLTERCNLRCQYCMPEAGVKLTEKSNLLTTDEIIKLAELFINEGVNKIRLTGGEPTVRKDLTEIISRLKSIQGLDTVAITTNGLMLTKQLVKLQRAGLDIINISLDTLNKNKYEQITRRKGWERVLMGIDLALQLNYDPVKVNCVLMKGFNDDELLDFVQYTKERNIYVRFIEYMPFNGNQWQHVKMMSYNEMLTNIKRVYPDLVELKNAPNDTSKAWKVPGFRGQIGFITSMTEHFCSTCNRLRLTADGNLKVCLFGNTEISLRDALRSKQCNDDDLKALISAAVKRKRKQHADNSNLTHIDAKTGHAQMVNISNKQITERTAKASAFINVGNEIINLIEKNSIRKGDVINVAKLAGILAAKKTSDLIPLCHNIVLNQIQLETSILDNEKILIESYVNCNGKTGVEMEALMAVTITALTIYDMCKSINKRIVISDIKLLNKTGGKSGDYSYNDDEIRVKNYDRTPIQHSETSIFVGSV